MDTGKSTGLVESLKYSLIPIAISAGVITHRVRVAISLDKMVMNYGSIMKLYVREYKKDPFGFSTHELNLPNTVEEDSCE